MSEQKGLLTRLGETIDQYRAERHTTLPEQPATRHRDWLRWLGRQMIPNIGTLVLVVVLLLTVPSLAAPRSAPEATSTSTISYQGRLADSAGNPLTGYYNLEFRIYDMPDGGAPLWEEFWTGGNSVQASDGLFNVMLGSINNTLAAAIEGHDELYLGITVGTDSEMVPRVQLGSVPFSMQAMTVADGSVTTEKVVDAAITTTKISDGAVTDAKLAAPISSQYIEKCFTYHATLCPDPVSDFSIISVGSNRLWSGNFPYVPFPTRWITAAGYIRLADDTHHIGDVPVAVWTAGSGVAYFSALLPDAYFNTVNSRLRVTLVGQ